MTAQVFLSLSEYEEGTSGAGISRPSGPPTKRAQTATALRCAGQKSRPPRPRATLDHAGPRRGRRWPQGPEPGASHVANAQGRESRASHCGRCPPRPSPTAIMRSFPATALGSMTRIESGEEYPPQLEGSHPSPSPLAFEAGGGGPPGEIASEMWPRPLPAAGAPPAARCTPHTREWMVPREVARGEVLGGCVLRALPIEIFVNPQPVGAAHTPLSVSISIYSTCVSPLGCLGTLTGTLPARRDCRTLGRQPVRCTMPRVS